MIRDLAVQGAQMALVLLLAPLLTGVVRKDDRAPLGYELGVTNLEVVQQAEEYPITPKEHGVAFLLDNRHLWLRSTRQHAVLRIRTGVIDLAVNAPDIKSANRTYSASWEAGEATLVIEARDSQTGALLGRALDRRLAGDTMPYLRNSVTNKADFKSLFRKWAKLSVDGLKRLQAQSPVNIARK